MGSGFRPKRLFVLAAMMSVFMAATPAIAQSGAAVGQYEEDGGGSITVTGTISEYGSTTFQYGTHGIVEDGTAVEYALRSSTVDLDEFDGERVTVSGTFVPGYESGQVENGPPLVDVSDVRTAEDGTGGSSVTGTVLEASADSVLVEDEAGGQYILAITPETGFVDGLSYIPGEAPPRAPNASDLRPGLTVQVFTTGPVAESFPAQGEAASIVFLSEWYEDEAQTVEKTLSGYVTDLGGDSVTVSEDPSLGVQDPQYCNRTIRFDVLDTTEVSVASNGQTVPAEAGDLAVGQRVDVGYTEDPDALYPSICPPQRTADSITILSGDSGSGNGDGTPDGGASGGGTPDNGTSDDGTPDDGAYGETSTSSGGVASDSYEVLPDTGGMGLAYLAAGAAIVVAGACLLVANRMRGRSSR